MNFTDRRERLAERLGDGALVLVAPPESVRSRDTHYPYRPHSDFWWVTGFAEPDAVLVFRPAASSDRLVLFVRPRDPEREVWDGRRAGPQGAMQDFGADAAFSIEELDGRMPDLLAEVDTVHFALGERPELDRRLLEWFGKLRGNRRQPDRAPTTIVDPRPLLHALRRIKDAAEIELLAAAGRLTAQAHLEAMRHTRPGSHEYAVQAHIERVFRDGGASGPAYTSIVAGGANACILHYTENDAVLKDGDLVLIDAGAELGMYAGDITRTWPVGSSFSPAQRDLYQAVLDVQIAAVESVRPGLRHEDLHEKVIGALVDRLFDLGILRGSREEALETESWKRYFMHGTGHYLGIDVHDVGPYYHRDGTSMAYEPGVALTIEPGLYVQPDDEDAPEIFRGTGVRIEDDVVVTEDGHRVLTADVPKDIATIEELRRAALEGA